MIRPGEPTSQSETPAGGSPHPVALRPPLRRGRLPVIPPLRRGGEGGYRGGLLVENRQKSRRDGFGVRLLRNQRRRRGRSHVAHGQPQRQVGGLDRVELVQV